MAGCESVGDMVESRRCPRSSRLRRWVGENILWYMRGKVVVGVAAAAVVGLYWARPDLMVALHIVLAMGV